MSSDEAKVQEKKDGTEVRSQGNRSRRGAQTARDRRANLVQVTRLIWLVAGILEAVLGIRFLLKLLAANPDAGFAQFIYGMTDVFLVPFKGLTATPSAGGAVLEIPTLIAMLVYGLLAWGIVRAVWVIFDRPSEA